MLFEELDKLKRTILMTTIILIFIGILLLVLPNSYVPFLQPTIAFILLVILFIIVFSFISSKKAIINYIILFFGLVAGLFGCLYFIFENFFIKTLYIFVGLIPILFGSYWIWQIITLKNLSKRKNWWLFLVLSIIMIGMGLFNFFNPWIKTNETVLLRITGGTLVFSALISALRLIWVWPIKKSN